MFKNITFFRNYILTILRKYVLYKYKKYEKTY